MHLGGDDEFSPGRQELKNKILEIAAAAAPAAATSCGAMVATLSLLNLAISNRQNGHAQARFLDLGDPRTLALKDSLLGA